MSSGTEEQLSVLTERRVVGISGHCVGRRFLLRERNIEFHSGALLCGRQHLGYLLLEKLAVIGRNSEVKIDRSERIGCCLGAFGHLLLERSARSVGILVKLQQTFGKAAIVHPFRLDESRDEFFYATGGYQLAGCDSIELHCRGVELGGKWQTGEIFHKLSHWRAGRRSVGLAVDKLKQSLEHAGCGSRSRHELGDLATLCKITVPTLTGFLFLLRRKQSYAASRTGGS